MKNLEDKLKRELKINAKVVSNTFTFPHWPYSRKDSEVYLYKQRQVITKILNMVSFEEFQKLDLRVARIIEAKRVQGSEKLLKINVDIGDEKRQLIAGIGKFYEPESLVGKEIVIVANLEPKMFMGLESQGMLLAADAHGPVLLIPQKEVPAGTKIR